MKLEQLKKISQNVQESLIYSLHILMTYSN